MSSSERTAEEAKADYQAKMGEDIGAVYSALWQEVASIHKKWGQYFQLFGTNPERIAVMNQAAPSMFRTVQDTLFENVLLHLARLTDPPRSTGKTNLSLHHLANLLVTSPIGSNVEALAKSALTACEFARDWRNRKLAHRDLCVALGQGVEPLAPASRAAVKSALEVLDAILNVVSDHYLGSTTMFELGPSGEDAISLLYLLRDGLQLREDRLTRIKRGELRYIDLNPEPL